MNKIIIWHNPRCRKSREGLAMTEQIAKQKSLTIKIIKYLDNPPNENELKNVLKSMGMKPMELIRTKESIWKENFKGKTLSDIDLIKAMSKFPKLIERPVVIHNGKAVLGRPAEAIKKIF